MRYDRKSFKGVEKDFSNLLFNETKLYGKNMYNRNSSYIRVKPSNIKFPSRISGSYISTEISKMNRSTGLESGHVVN